LQDLKHRFALAVTVFQWFRLPSMARVGSIGLRGVLDWKYSLAKSTFEVNRSAGVIVGGRQGEAADA
jgi:hypothetical protein